MFNKKEIVALNEDMAELKKTIESELASLKTEVKVSSEAMGSIRDKLKAIEVSNESGHKKIEEQLHSIEKVKTEFEKSVRRFIELQRHVESFIYDELSDAIKNSIGKLGSDVDRYSDVKKEIERTVSQIASLNAEIGKLKAIAGEIKQADFELGKYARELEKTDGEKLRLMREVDTLQRLVSKLRRGQR